MKLKTLLRAAVIAAIAIGITACNGKKDGEQSTKDDAATSQVVDNKDEMTFLQTFLNKYITLNGKEAQELARKHLTEDFYSRYIELCSNKDDMVDLIMEVAIDEKVEKIDTIMKGIEDPSSYIVQVEAKGVDGQPFTTQYDMTVVNEEGKFKIGDSQIND
jgi:hypothetical protein